jgi:hypothetical protein
MDMDGQLLCVLLDPLVKDGETMIIWDAEANEIMEDMKLSLSQYLEQIRD